MHTDKKNQPQDFSRLTQEKFNHRERRDSRDCFILGLGFGNLLRFGAWLLEISITDALYLVILRH